MATSLTYMVTNNIYIAFLLIFGGGKLNPEPIHYQVVKLRLINVRPAVHKYDLRKWYLILILDIKNSGFLISRTCIFDIKKSNFWYQEFYFYQELHGLINSSLYFPFETMVTWKWNFWIKKSTFLDIKSSNSWYQELGLNIICAWHT